MGSTFSNPDPYVPFADLNAYPASATTHGQRQAPIFNFVGVAEGNPLLDPALEMRWLRDLELMSVELFLERWPSAARERPNCRLIPSMEALVERLHGREQLAGCL